MRTVVAGDGYLSQSSKRLHFGLAAAGEVDRIVVRWPGGPAEAFDGVPADHAYLILEGSGEITALPRRDVNLLPAPAHSMRPA